MSLLSGKPALVLVSAIALPVILALGILGRAAVQNLPKTTEAITKVLETDATSTESSVARVATVAEATASSSSAGYIQVDAEVGSVLDGFTIVMSAPTMSECQMLSPIIIPHLPTHFRTAVPPQHVWYPRRGDSTVFVFQCRDVGGQISVARKVIALK